MDRHLRHTLLGRLGGVSLKTNQEITRILQIMFSEGILIVLSYANASDINKKQETADTSPLKTTKIVQNHSYNCCQVRCFVHTFPKAAILLLKG